ncbi:hypothetical protein DNTS_015419 [Danionella cerebrum]|uniref:FHF complex subunit HOOK-interacting protein C-terminal domain-containing protein n=1 Tax=Danionella cerebrum TaxID=2873325 RepID=A0A553R3W3_9TELE|nr:hypothetical protein DNTS_015419 [Danionella translucida]
MDMFSKVTAFLQQALETREPTINLLDSFVDHWKAITNYYIETTDECRAVKNTDIPWRLRQMLDILVFEEKEQGDETGPCMEYLLQHKIMETLCTLGKAQYPPGMSQQVLVFFSKVLTQLQKPVLHLINVYRPVQKLIRLCGRPASQTEREESLFLFAVCTRVNKDPYVLNYILEVLPSPSPAISILTHAYLHHRSSQTPGGGLVLRRRGATEPPVQRGHPLHHHQVLPPPFHPVKELFLPNKTLLASSLCSFTWEKVSFEVKPRVALRSLESLLLLVSSSQEDTAHLLAEGSPLCDLLAQRLTELYSLVPSSIDPGDVHGYPCVHWRDQFTEDAEAEGASFPGCEDLRRFLCGVDYCNELIQEAPAVWTYLYLSKLESVALVSVRDVVESGRSQLFSSLGEDSCLVLASSSSAGARVLGTSMAVALECRWLRGAVQPQLLQMSEAGILVHTSLLTVSARHIGAPVLLEELVHFMLGSETRCETQQDVHSHLLRHRLIQHCNHISDEISIASLRLFEELLQKPSRSILNNLVLRNLEHQSYKVPGSGAADDRHGAESDALEESEELEEDPFFTDLFDGGGFSCQETLARPGAARHSQAVDVVNSFLCLVPQEARSSHLVQGSGYDTYVHDAHRMFKECSALVQNWNWPDSGKTAENTSTSDFFEGHFLQTLFDRMGLILEQVIHRELLNEASSSLQRYDCSGFKKDLRRPHAILRVMLCSLSHQPYELNLQVTSILSRLAMFPHPHLHEYLLDPYISLSPGARSLFSTLVRVMGDLMQRLQSVHEVTESLLATRRQLMGLEEEAR